MKNLIYSIVLFLVLVSCSEEESSLADDKQRLEQLFNEITNLANSKSCDNSEEWSFVAHGVKPCGGPWGYIAYPKTINVTSFLQKIENYNALNKRINEREGAISDCLLIAKPVEVICENGKPVLLYYSINTKN